MARSKKNTPALLNWRKSKFAPGFKANGGNPDRLKKLWSEFGNQDQEELILGNMDKLGEPDLSLALRALWLHWLFYDKLFKKSQTDFLERIYETLPIDDDPDLSPWSTRPFFKLSQNPSYEQVQQGLAVLSLNTQRNNPTRGGRLSDVLKQLPKPAETRKALPPSRRVSKEEAG